MAGLGDLAGGDFDCKANACSDNGAVVVGEAESNTRTQAFRGVDGAGMSPVGDLPGGQDTSNAYGCSANGSIFVNVSSSASGSEAFKWTAGGGMVGLGDLPGGPFRSWAVACSNDGSVVIGYASPSDGTRPFVWNAADGMRLLRAVIEDNGDDLTGWTLTNVTDVSADGRTFVGAGTNPLGQRQPFGATIIPEPTALLLLLGGSLGAWLRGHAAHVRRCSAACRACR
jgi:probable HAF family extracellular repeat protein